MNRHIENIKASQEHELHAIEDAQKSQFLEFSDSWDKYMSDYEATAIKNVESMKVYPPHIIGTSSNRIG